MDFNSFSLFPSLPTELRLKIWRDTFPGRRLISFTDCCEIRAGKIITLSINQESRDEALRFYKLFKAPVLSTSCVWPPRPRTYFMYIDCSIDMPCFDWWSLFRDWHTEILNSMRVQGVHSNSMRIAVDLEIDITSPRLKEWSYYSGAWLYKQLIEMHEKEKVLEVVAVVHRHIGPPYLRHTQDPWNQLGFRELKEEHQSIDAHLKHTVQIFDNGHIYRGTSRANVVFAEVLKDGKSCCNDCFSLKERERVGVRDVLADDEPWLSAWLQQHH